MGLWLSGLGFHTPSTVVSPSGYADWPELSSHLGDDVVLTKKENKGRQGIRKWMWLLRW